MLLQPRTNCVDSSFMPGARPHSPPQLQPSLFSSLKANGYPAWDVEYITENHTHRNGSRIWMWYRK
jgi:hypothetical protein